MAKKKKKAGKILSFLLFIVINIIIFNRVMIFNETKNIIGFGEIQLNEINKVKIEYEINDSENSKIVFLDGYILTFEGDRITLFSDNGEVEWIKINEFDGNLVSSNSNFFVIADKRKGNIYVYNYRGDINASLFGLGEIKSIQVSEAGYILVQLEGSNGIRIFNPQLSILSDITIPKGSISKYKMNNKDNCIFVSVVDISETNIDSYLYKFNIEGNLVGSIQMLDEILLNFFIDDEKLIKITDKELGIYNIEMEELEVINNVGEINVVSYFDGTVFSQRFNKANNIIGNDIDYNLIGFNVGKNQIEFNQITNIKYNKILNSDDNIICYNNNTLDIYKSNGEFVKTFSMQKDIKSVSMLNGKEILLIGLDYFKIYQLRY